MALYSLKNVIEKMPSESLEGEATAWSYLLSLGVGVKIILSLLSFHKDRLILFVFYYLDLKLQSLPNADKRSIRKITRKCFFFFFTVQKNRYNFMS